MSVQSDAAKRHIETLFHQQYPEEDNEKYSFLPWMKEHCFSKFDTGRKWRFDYADFVHRCAIELDGATFKPGTGHNSGVGLRGWREKHNAAMSAGWRVWHYSPEEIIRSGRKTPGGYIYNATSPLLIASLGAKPCPMNRFSKNCHGLQRG